MLSYRHAFHAGNHADVFKHLVLTLLIRTLLQKEKPFLYLETHAGAGHYSLRSTMAQKNREYETGIGRIWNDVHPHDMAEDYLRSVRVVNPGKSLHYYPGSPKIVRSLLRPCDRMVLCEWHSTEVEYLFSEFRKDRQVRIEHCDGYHAIKAYLPPLQRRGLVHIDPSFELKDERRRLLEAIKEGYRRWPTGIFAIWYPIQDKGTANHFLRSFQRLNIPKILLVELMVLPDVPFRLNGSGLIIINPPWQVEEKLRKVLPWLWEKLAISKQGEWRLMSNSI